MRRVATVLGAASVVVFGMAIPALAQDTDLQDWLDRANAAEYSGRHVTVCETPAGERAEFVTLSQRAGLLVIDAGSEQSVVSRGEFYDLSQDGTVRASSMDLAASWTLSDRYRAVLAEATTVLDRPADRVRVMEGGLVRIELAFDQESGAVLRSIAYNDDGSIYCTSSFVSFSEEAVVGSKPVAQSTAVLVPVETNGAGLPVTLGGFERKEVFEGPGGSIAGFYSDGLFTFTVLVADRPVHIAGLDTARRVTIDGHRYERVFLAGQSVYSWTTRDGGYVMLGDQPLDLQEAVLADLPEPGSPGIITRLWRRLFG